MACGTQSPRTLGGRRSLQAGAGAVPQTAAAGGVLGGVVIARDLAGALITGVAPAALGGGGGERGHVVLERGSKSHIKRCVCV